jgi:hypothetical protein
LQSSQYRRRGENFVVLIVQLLCLTIGHGKYYLRRPVWHCQDDDSMILCQPLAANRKRLNHRQIGMNRKKPQIDPKTTTSIRNKKYY